MALPFFFLCPRSLCMARVHCHFFFNYLWHGSEFNGSDKAECKETGRFPVCFTAAASILCYILVPISWRLLKNFIGNLVKHPDPNGALATVLVLPFLFGFCVILLKHSSEFRYREEILEDCKEFSKFRY
ncbi:Uncharacterized protein TCM_021665 [Theobroma cacao]|uniref:Uncharacterized protein n=1 Tax=Theobroma cacao TaxID=3641 RepID=A0A061EQ78_THECC|nr:Uncharacterized protein TCM_021665 [Theobroma cacao]